MHILINVDPALLTYIINTIFHIVKLILLVTSLYLSLFYTQNLDSCSFCRVPGEMSLRFLLVFAPIRKLTCKVCHITSRGPTKTALVPTNFIIFSCGRIFLRMGEGRVKIHKTNACRINWQQHSL